MSKGKRKGFKRLGFKKRTGVLRYKWYTPVFYDWKDAMVHSSPYFEMFPSPRPMGIFEIIW